MKEISFRKALERAGQHNFCTGNEVRVLEDGDVLFDGVFEAVKRARRLICLEYYIFRDDETGWSLAELLARRSREGIRVHLIYDHFGSISTPERFWRYLRQHGVQVLPFHPPRLTNFNLYFHRDHRKLTVVDGEVAFTGGLNVGDEYRGYIRKKLAGWRDTGVMVRGPASAFLLEAFGESWQECGGGEIEAGPEADGPAADPAGEGVALLPLLSSSRRGMRALRRLLQFSLYSSRSSIHLTMAYFIPTRKFLMGLIRAARRGVDVKIILPGRSDLRLVSYVSRTYFQMLLQDGVRIYLYQPRILHAKTMIFDGGWTIVGSANLDARSLNYNHECGIGMLDSGLGAEMERLFQHDLRESRPIQEEDLARWPFHERALGTFFSWFHSYL